MSCCVPELLGVGPLSSGLVSVSPQLQPQYAWSAVFLRRADVRQAKATARRSKAQDAGPGIYSISISEVMVLSQEGEAGVRGPGLPGWGKSTYSEPQLSLSDPEYERPPLPDGWGYNHTQLDCYDDCKSWKLIRGNLKVSSFCCEGQDFCNKYKGRSQKWKPR